MGKVLKIYGSPGTGKTTRIIEEIQKRDVPLLEILGVTFTRQARRVLTERLGIAGNDHWIRTQHSTNMKLLKIEKERIANAHIQDFAEKFRYGMRVRKGDSVDETFPFFVDDQILKIQEIGDLFLSEYDRARSTLKDPSSARLGTLTKEYLSFVKNYEGWKKENGYVDFIDVIIFGIEKKVCPPCSLYIHDEFQDCTPLLAKQALFWMEQIPETIIAGDDDQSIYGYAGATPSIMNDIQGEEVVLERTYRFGSEIKKFADNIISHNKDRKQKVYTTEKEGGYVVRVNDLNRIIDGLRRYKDKTTYILARNRCFLLQIDRQLKERGVLVNASKEKIYAIKFFLEPPAEITKLELLLFTSGLFPSATYFLRGTKKKIKEMLGFVHEGLVEYSVPFEQFCADFDVKPQLIEDFKKRNPTNLKIEKEEFRSLVRSIKIFGYDSPDVKLATIHGAKGGEADLVFLFTDITKKVWEEENFGDKESERRVWYVGATRVKEILAICDGVLSPHNRKTSLVW